MNRVKCFLAVKSAARVLEVFECLNDFPEGLTMKELGEQLSLPQSSMFQLVGTLHEKKYLVKTEDKRYKLGPKLIHIGARAMESIDLYAEAQPFLRRLMERVEETVFMAVLAEREVVYVSKVDSRRSVSTSAQIGSRKPLHCTGLGKAFLAFLPQGQSEEIFSDTTLNRMTPKTVTNEFELKRQLESYRQQGYAVDDGENEEGLFCLAAPVFDVNQQIVAAISIAGPRERIVRQEAEISHHLLATAGRISARIGG